MSDTKTTCSKCSAAILIATAQRTGGLCMPCMNGTRKSPSPKVPVIVSCEISSKFTPQLVIFTEAQVLLEVLDQTRHIGDSRHPNKFEIEAQRALLRHFIRVNHDLRLHDDHWGRTGWALLSLFEQGRATIEFEKHRYEFSKVTKVEWQEGDHPLGMEGGFSYVTSEGTTIFKTTSWIS